MNTFNSLFYFTFTLFIVLSFQNCSPVGVCDNCISEKSLSSSTTRETDQNEPNSNADNEVDDNSTNTDENSSSSNTPGNNTNNLDTGNSNAVLNFTDLISGPDTGLGDGKGSGTIVTVWAQNIGDSQQNSRLIFKDSMGTEYNPYIYYWKKADGTLPSGVANLYDSHKMQEIAFSIPDSAEGAGSIYIELSDGTITNKLPFTVRPGQIYHVRSSGNDNNDGSYSSPLKTISGAISKNKKLGTIVYVHDVDTGSSTDTGNIIQWRSSVGLADASNQSGLVSYPGYQPKVIGRNAISVYKANALVVSKLSVFASNYTEESSTGQPTGTRLSGYGKTFTSAITGSAYGRIVGNKITDIPGGCSSSMSGAISGGSKYDDYVSMLKVYGNEVHDYGCPGASKLHHTTYLSIRSGDDNEQLPAPEMAWNYLHDNHTKNGLHIFDQGRQGTKKGPNNTFLTNNCGNFTGKLKIHSNVIVNQAGAGIFVGTSNCDSANYKTHIYNNLIINPGLPAAWDGVDVSTQDGKDPTGISVGSNNNETHQVYNNTIIDRPNSELNLGESFCFGAVGGGFKKAIFSNNICEHSRSSEIIGFGYRADLNYDIKGLKNVIYNSENTGSSIPSYFTDSITTNPMVNLTGVQTIIDFKNYGSLSSYVNHQLSDASPILNTQVPDENTPARDLAGRLRSQVTTPGALD